MRLLYAEDEPAMAEAVTDILTYHKYMVDTVDNGQDALEYALDEDYDGIILDIMMPRMDGLTVLTKLRASGKRTPVLLLTAKAEVSDRIQGLDMGADDYLPKPFELEELDARLRALLRRSEGRTQERQLLGELEYDDDGFFLLHDEPLSLTPRELSLLKVLMHRRTRPVSRQQLFDQVFSLNDDVSPESIDLYIHRLRKKLSGSGVKITTLRGLGYVLECGDEVG